MSVKKVIALEYFSGKDFKSWHFHGIGAWDYSASIFLFLCCTDQLKGTLELCCIQPIAHIVEWPNFSQLREAWRDHRFPAPFSWFLHETGLEDLKITSARCFSLKCQRKDSKKAKEDRQFLGVLGRWRTAAIDRTTFHACQTFRKTAIVAVFSRLCGANWRVKAFRDQQC